MDRSKGICKICGKQFNQQLLSSGRYSKKSFCSKECENKNNDKYKIIKTKICKYCGKEFEVKRTNNGKNFSTTDYCSEQCNQEHIAEKHKKVCAYCGKEFIPEKMPSGHFGKSPYCSIECQRKYNDEHNRKTKICAYCGKEFTPNRCSDGSISGMQKYCSDLCRKAKEEENRQTIKCKYCGKEFKPLRLSNGRISKAQYCNEECRTKDYDKNKLKEKTCLYCGKKFKPKRLDNGKLSQSNYCSDDCWYNGYQRNYVASCQEKYGVDYACMMQKAQEKQGQIISQINKNFANDLKNVGIDYELETIRLDNYSYDIYIRNKSLLIEIDPSYTHTTVGNHFNNFKYNEKFINYQLNKTLVAQKYGYNCMHIFDWDDRNKILGLLKPKIEIEAEYMIVKEVTQEEAKSFISKYSLYTDTIQQNNSHYLGLFNCLTNDLIKLAILNSNNRLSFCNCFDYYVNNGIKILLKSVIDNYKPLNLMITKDLSKDFNDYTKYGFTLKSIVEPQKIWSKTKEYIVEDNNCNTKQLLSQGWLPVYNCGYEKYELILGANDAN